MPSSGSTRNRRPKAPLRLLVVLAGEDHPKACTGRRLVRLGRVVPVPHKEGSPLRPIILDPYSSTPLSAADRGPAERGGLLAVDCSWNRLTARGTFPGTEFGNRSHGAHRRLPMLVATNPQHYGRLAQLNTVEALSAALSILGRGEEAQQLIAGFRGGAEFLTVNRTRLERYRAAAAPADIVTAEKSLFGAT